MRVAEGPGALFSAERTDRFYEPLRDPLLVRAMQRRAPPTARRPSDPLPPRPRADKFCSPSRSSLIGSTGRFAQHVNMHNLALTVPPQGC